MKNADVAKIFREIADLLEIQETSFKPQAYRRAARSIEQLEESLVDIAVRGELEEIRGVGKAIASKIQEIIDTGDIEYLHRLKNEVDKNLVELLRVPDVGPKTIRVFHQELGIKSIADLRAAIAQHKIQELPGFGPRSEEKLRKNIELMTDYSERLFIGTALPIAESIVANLQKLSEVLQIEIAGSLRRWKETIGDIDILVSSRTPVPVMQAFINLPSVLRVLAQGPTRASVIVQEGIQVDLRLVKPESFGAALQYFTGSKAHNIAMRRLARQHRWKLSEYSLLDTKTNKIIAGESEKAIYSALGMNWIPPELREDRGEIEAAQANKLPSLIQEHELRGDLHVHSAWSDGADTIEDIAKAAIHRNYEYLAICDHSKQVAIANGLDEVRLSEQISYIRDLNNRLDSLQLLAGIEVDVLPDGALDLSEDVLAETDLVIAAIHLPRKTKKSITDLLIKACQNEFVDILAHPIGRIVGQRPGFSIDFSAVFNAAKQNGIILEINSSHRLDLSPELSHQAKDKGIKFALNTDAHRISQLDFIRYGVGVARRGWIETKDVVNTLPFNQLRKFLKHVH